MTRLVIALLLLDVTSVAAQQWTVNSPDGLTAITLTRQGTGQLFWRATRGSVPVIADSPLGIKRNDHDFVNGLVFLSAADVSEIDERYTTLHGKRREHQVRGRERAIVFENET